MHARLRHTPHLQPRRSSSTHPRSTSFPRALLCLLCATQPLLLHAHASSPPSPPSLTPHPSLPTEPRTPLLSNQAAQIQLIPISRELGLYDLIVTLTPTQANTEPPKALYWLAQSGAEQLRVALTPNADATRWTGRAKHATQPRDQSTPLQGHLELIGTQPQQIPFAFPQFPTLPPDFEIPAWALGTTWYQIFPERFRNGDPSNDPRAPETALVPWTSDFSDITIEEIELAWSRARSGVRRQNPNMNARGGSRRATIYSRRYGGDLLGVTDKLDHIASIGVESLYFCPVFASSSLHKYDARDFRHIDPTFGPIQPNHLPTTPHSTPSDPSTPTIANSPADTYFLETLLPTARAKGFRVILDGVWNHTGMDFWAFQHLIQNGRESPYANWFQSRFNESGELVGWTGWEGPNGNLPEFIQTPAGDLAPPVKAHIFDVTSRWMDPNADGDPSDGIDGWRLDVAAEVGMPFWRDWRAHVRSLNPNATTVGEIWFDAGPWFNGNAFDSQMNYPFAMPVVEWISGSPSMTSAQLKQRLERVFSHAPHHDLAQMNLLVSHDTARLVTLMQQHATTYDDGTSAAALGHASIHRRPNDEAFKRSLLGVAIQATYLGSPMIYAGDELGMFGPDDPDNRKPLSWPDLGPWENPDDAPDLSILDAYRQWFTLRQDPVWGDLWRYGALTHLDTNAPDLLLYSRTLNDQVAYVAVNRSTRPLTLAGSGAILAQIRTTVVPPLTAIILYPANANE